MEIIESITDNIVCALIQSTTHTIFDEIVHFIDTGESTVKVFCDLSRAFDWDDHKILLKKLANYG